MLKFPPPLLPRTVLGDSSFLAITLYVHNYSAFLLPSIDIICYNTQINNKQNAMKNRIKFSIIVSLAFLGSWMMPQKSLAAANTWTTIGTAGFGPGTSMNWEEKIIFDPVTKNPWVLVWDSSNDLFSVMKYVAGSWSYVGNSAFNSGNPGHFPVLVFNPQTNEPYVAFRSGTDSARYNSVMKFNGTNWVYVGQYEQFADNWETSNIATIFLDFDPVTNDPYVLQPASDTLSGGKLMRYNSPTDNWTSVGPTTNTYTLVNDTISTSFYIEGFAFNKNTHRPNALIERHIQSYDMYNQDFMLMEFNGTTWSQVGGMINSSADYTYPGYPDLVFNPVTNEPYVAYQRSGCKIKKFDGANWTNIGNGQCSTDTAYAPHIAFDLDTNIPYVSFTDDGINNNSDQATVTKLNGSSWDVVGQRGFSSQATSNVQIAFNPTTKEPWVAFRDSANGNRTTVMKFNSNTVEAPTASPAAGIYTSIQSVTLSTTTSGAEIRYTTNGSTPSASSTLYSGPISVSSSQTIKAIAIKSGMGDSDIFSGTYTINIPPTVSTPTASPAGGTPPDSGTCTDEDMSITLSSSTPDVTIYYTTNNTDPSRSSTQYTEPINITESAVIKAFAVKSGMLDSQILTQNYCIVVHRPILSPAGGTYDDPQTVTMTLPTRDSLAYYTLDGSDPYMRTGGAWYTNADPYDIIIDKNTTLKTIAFNGALVAGFPVTANYYIKTKKPSASISGSTYSSNQSITLSSTTSGARIYYTLNGSTPSVSSIEFVVGVSAPISISSTTTIKAIAIKSDLTNSDVMSETYTIISLATPIYRLYNTKNGAFLYTKGEADRDFVLNKFHDFEFTDGIPAYYSSLDVQDGLTPIYRLYNTKNGAFLYTKGDADRDYVLNKFHDFEFTDGAPAFYAPLTYQEGLTPIYRLYNRVTGMFLYTRGEADRDYVLNKWSDFEFTDGTPAFYAKTN
ncbi:MAG: chitobiase/beta-hexosaminidase C-terminal domain-containing protein [Candidatus Moranbacteria bacterium]|nr:chitobiase/beta-hexosaminidase C-terminal domain-containing protein [Candidatus Moranbacteria bacterium]